MPPIMNESQNWKMKIVREWPLKAVSRGFVFVCGRAWQLVAVCCFWRTKLLVVCGTLEVLTCFKTKVLSTNEIR